jgi:putative ATP-dependent endonuclease of OLD family
VARIRQIEIKNFRGIASLTWDPSPGVNCLVGPGDSGKSTILDAIDLSIGARRTVQFTDSDFHGLDVEKPISISVTVGELSDALKTMEAYGLYLRGYNDLTGLVEDEPGTHNETVLTVNLTVSSDLEPVWTLISERAAAQGQSRNLAWAERAKIAPTRLGAYADYNLAWRRGSVLNLLSEEKPDASSALVRAAREARIAFSEQAEKQLSGPLSIVEEAAKELGIPFGGNLKAMLDSHSISFSGGTISLHDDDGVPLRSLGVGSTRLLIASLQRKTAGESSIILVDELEHGLEPHRITRLLGSIGVKEEEPPLQAFVTTHSPAAIRELKANHLYVVRAAKPEHRVRNVPSENNTEATIRLYPEALLAPLVVVCEGASEVGLLRGLDQYRWGVHRPSLAAMGVALVDGNGIDQVFKRAQVFANLGYLVAVVRDDDVKPAVEAQDAFAKVRGKITAWREGRALEDELFLSLSDAAIKQLLEYAVELHGDELVDAHIRSASAGKSTLAACKADLTLEVRALLGVASRTKKAGWFKSVTWMEHAAREIVAPDLNNCDKEFSRVIYDLFRWMENGGT